MRTMAAATTAFILVAGCAEGLEMDGPGGDGGSGGSGGDDTEVGPIACSDSRPCSPGTSCRNGACAAGCNTDADCEDSEYCATSAGQLCQPKSVSTCPDVPCAETQACIDGLCGMQIGTPCGSSPFGGEADGCPEDQVCLSQVHVDGTYVEDKQCYSLPSCGAGDACPTDGGGARCTSGLMEGKDPLCVPGVCLSAADCPESSLCVIADGGVLDGHCTDGAVGSLCATTADCKASSCVIMTAGKLGICQ